MSLAFYLGRRYERERLASNVRERPYWLGETLAAQLAAVSLMGKHAVLKARQEALLSRAKTAVDAECRLLGGKYTLRIEFDGATL